MDNKNNFEFQATSKSKRFWTISISKEYCVARQLDPLRLLPMCRRTVVDYHCPSQWHEGYNLAQALCPMTYIPRFLPGNKKFFKLDLLKINPPKSTWTRFQ